MSASPGMRFSPGREPRTDKHKRVRSLESGISFKERDDDLALFNEVQTRERDDFLLQSNDDFEDTFVSKLRHFSDHKVGINIASRGESSEFLNAEEEKNDYEWLVVISDIVLSAFVLQLRWKNQRTMKRREANTLSSGMNLASLLNLVSLKMQ